MPTKPCKCSDGHRYSRTEAKDLRFVCDKDGQPITCPVPKPVAPSGKPKSGAGKPSRRGR